MVEAGLSRKEAHSRFVLCTNMGAIGAPTGAHGNPNHAPLHATHVPWVNDTLADGTSLLQAIKQFKPHVLLGLSTASGLFTKEVVQTMAAQLPGQRPIIMPMSNPTSRAECTPQEAYEWTDGCVLFLFCLSIVLDHSLTAYH